MLSNELRKDVLNCLAGTINMFHNIGFEDENDEFFVSTNTAYQTFLNEDSLTHGDFVLAIRSIGTMIGLIEEVIDDEGDAVNEGLKNVLSDFRGTYDELKNLIGVGS